MAFTTPKGRTHTSLSEINVTPFVDVMMVLLVIFMITAPLLESGIEVDLPKTKTVKVVSDEKVVVTIDKKQTIYVGNDPVNIHRLGASVLDHMHGATTHRSSSAATKRSLRGLRPGGGRAQAGESYEHQRRDGAAVDPRPS